jgi:hypothetical protein
VPVLTLPWLGAVVTIVVTAVAFVALTRQSAGGPVPWSIVAGLARGIRTWSRSREDLTPFRLISPQAEDAAPPLDTSLLTLAPLEKHPREPEAWVEEGVDPAILAEVEIEELGPHRL